MAGFGFRIALVALIVFVILCAAMSYYDNAPVQKRPRKFMKTEFIEQPSPETEVPTIFIITVTIARLEQKADLTRMSQTLKLVPNVYWIVVEDSNKKTKLVSNLLKDSGLRYTHVNAPTETGAKRKPSGQLHARGIEQRNAGLKWLRFHPYPLSLGGVVYFADEDNTYSLKLFEEMRFTQKVSVWPVGDYGDLPFETPIVEHRKVVGWLAWAPTRMFAVDVSGFAVNLQLVFDHKDAVLVSGGYGGYMETSFLSRLGVAWTDLEPKAALCTKILVWHRRRKTTTNKSWKLEDYIFIKDGIANKDRIINTLRKNIESHKLFVYTV